MKVKWEKREIDFEYHIVDDDGQCKIMLYVKFVLDRETLVSVAKKEREKHVWFYLPGMSGTAEPCAIAKRSRSEYSCFIKKKNLVSEETLRIRGVVEHVDNGDLLTVKFDDYTFRVRLLGIEAPERKKLFHKDSKKHLEDMCLNKEVVVFSRKQNSDSEFLGFVKFEDKNLNEAMIRDGYARADRDAIQDGYLVFEKNAKSLKKGFWK